MSRIPPGHGKLPAPHSAAPVSSAKRLEADGNTQEHKEAQRNGSTTRFSGVVFRAAAPPGPRRPVALGPRRPMNRPQIAQDHDHDQDPAVLRETASPRAVRLVRRLDLGNDLGKQHDPEQPDHAPGAAEDNAFKQRFRPAKAGQPLDGAGDLKGHTVPPRTDDSSLRAMTRESLELLDRMRDDPHALALARAGLLKKARAMLQRLRQEAGMAAQGLQGVRALLIAAAKNPPQSGPGSQALKDLHQLLPLVLLNMERPRTEKQADRAIAKLEILAR
jgi:hypothetical protein